MPSAAGALQVLGLLVSWSTFLMIGATSGLTFNVVGNLKLIIVLAGGVLFFGDVMPAKKFAGVCLALSGIFWYSYQVQLVHTLALGRKGNRLPVMSPAARGVLGLTAGLVARAGAAEEEAGGGTSKACRCRGSGCWGGGAAARGQQGCIPARWQRDGMRGQGLETALDVPIPGGPFEFCPVDVQRIQPAGGLHSRGAAKNSVAHISLGHGCCWCGSSKFHLCLRYIGCALHAARLFWSQVARMSGPQRMSCHSMPPADACYDPSAASACTQALVRLLPKALAASHHMAD